MKKIFLSSLVVLGLSASIIVVSCKDKNNNSITPTYRNQAPGTGGNPCINCITVTGTVTPITPATQNSSLLVGGSGWSYNSCSSAPNVMTGFTGSTQVQLLFGGGPITTGVYALTSGIPSSGQARLTVNNAPNQPEGIVWYSKSGSVSIVTTTANTTATFNNVQCTQASPYIFPVVSVSGTLTCSG